MKKITVIGTGYVGLVTGASLADFGHQVICLDIDRGKIESLKKGQVPFFEPGLQELVERGIESGRLCFQLGLFEALQGAEFCFLALPTPSLADQSCDERFVLSATRSVAKAISGPLIVINKSTVPVGTAARLRQVMEEEMHKRGRSHPLAVVSNPEFLREGSAVHDFKQPERIVIGVDSPWAQEKVCDLYAPFADKLIITDIASSELAKYAANAMLAMRLTMINTFSILCQALSCDIEAIRTILGKDPRIGHQYLSPGAGFGGSCLPKDVRALSAICRQIGHPTSLFDAILQVNWEVQQAFFEKILTYYGRSGSKVLAIWGLSFKPDTDDIRESPAITLIQQLLDAGHQLRLYDPAAMERAKDVFGQQVDFCHSEIAAATGTDGIILMTGWKRFSYVDFGALGPLMHTKVLFDGRNLLIDHRLSDLGFDYLPIGKAPIPQAVLS